MTTTHLLKRKSVKPSSSTVRGMLTPAQYKILDSSLQSLRSTGIRFEWKWKDKKTGWVCAGVHEEQTLCEIMPADAPIIGTITLTPEQVKALQNYEEFPETYKKILEFPVKKLKTLEVFEFGLDTTPERDLFSDYVEKIQQFLDE